MTRDQYVVWLHHKTKSALVAIVEDWARRHGRLWVLGGPTRWNKDELISACLRIWLGGEP